MFLMLLLTVPALLCAEENTAVVKKTEYVTFSDWLNARPYTIYMDEKEEKKALREKWLQALGFDIFFPYFKAHEMKTKVEEKSEIKVLNLKGKARIHEDEAKFIFNVKF